jgi:hypothetical protein
MTDLNTTASIGIQLHDAVDYAFKQRVVSRFGHMHGLHWHVDAQDKVTGWCWTPQSDDDGVTAVDTNNELYEYYIQYMLEHCSRAECLRVRQHAPTPVQTWRRVWDHYLSAASSQ